jgi:hypothetical protein
MEPVAGTRRALLNGRETCGEARGYGTDIGICLHLASAKTPEQSVLPVTVTYLILAHDRAPQLARLVAALPTSSPVFIHFDLRAKQSDFESAKKLLGDRPNLRFVERHWCRWGAIGIVRGTVSLIQAAQASGQHFDYAILLSATDYPIKSHRDIANFLHENRGKEFIESFSLTIPNRWSKQGGYYKAPDRLVCCHFRVASRIFRVPVHRRLPYGLRPYGGEQWWCLSNEAITYIAKFVDRNPKLLRFCKQSFIPDEAFIQIILSNSYLADRITGDSLRFSIWDRPNPPYPAILGIGDLDVLLTSHKLFARKFDMTRDSGIFDALDDRNGAG